MYPLRLLFSGVAEIARGRGDAQTTLGEVGLLSIVGVLNLNRIKLLIGRKRKEM
jgi:hypothetical protein